MGARVYLPTIGRFAQVDPVEGGTENNYVYPTDPVNEFDLDGRQAYRSRPGGVIKNGRLGYYAKNKSTAGKRVFVPDTAYFIKWYVKQYKNKPGLTAPQGHRGGGIYKNDGRGGTYVLPAKTKNNKPITYREWDVNPYRKGQNRGGERVISGSDGSFWYTNDHYKSFVNIGR